MGGNNMTYFSREMLLYLKVFKPQFEVSLYLVRMWPRGLNSTKDLLIITNTKWLCLCVYRSDSDRVWRHLHVGHQSAANQSSACYCKSPPTVHLLLCAVEQEVCLYFLYHKNQQIPWKDEISNKCILLATNICVEKAWFSHLVYL